jgi:transcriptional regulator with PAS, ATPase and Fis domain
MTLPPDEELATACLAALARALGRAELAGDPAPLAAALETLAGAAVVVDAGKRIVCCNQRAARMVGRDAARMIGRSCVEALHCTTCGAGCPLFEEGSICERQAALVRGDGVPIHVVKDARVLFDERGRVVGGIETMQDVTDLIRAAADGTRRGLDEVVPVKAPGDERPFQGIVGRAPAIRHMARLVRALAGSDAPVLITGESGVGKELVARALHLAGPRAARPFVAVNCAALSEPLLESELFGHDRGAFTGAIRDHPGRLELAADGTLLLDEIACLSPTTQAKLLRVLEGREFERVGGSRVRRLDARVVAATNADLAARVKDGSFREDLFYRLHVVPIRVPPLRERRGDIGLLAEHFVGTFATAGGPQAITAAARAALEAYAWPGNVRELRNAIQYALATGDGRTVDVAGLPGEVRAGVAGDPDERARIERALREAKYNRARAAETLGMGRTTLWRKLRAFGLE